MSKICTTYIMDREKNKRMGAEQGGNRKTAAGVDKKEETDIFQGYDEEEKRKPGERNYTGEHAGWESKRQTKNEMDGQHQNLDRTGYEGATEIGGEQTGMEECCAERIQRSDRGWIRTEQSRTIRRKLLNTAFVETNVGHGKVAEAAGTLSSTLYFG